jgi:hypothetical protein
MGGSRASGQADLVRDVEAEKQDHVDAPFPPTTLPPQVKEPYNINGSRPDIGVVAGDLSHPSDSTTEKTLINVMACVLEQLVLRNDQLPFDPATATVFHGLRSPNVSIHSYLTRIFKYTNVSSGCLVCALLYIDRFIQRNKNILLTSRSVHRLLITSVVVSMKFLDDLYYNNVYYAKIGGIPASEMNTLELEFLFRLNFDLHAPQEEYERYFRELTVHAQYATSCACAQQNYAQHSPPCTKQEYFCPAPGGVQSYNTPPVSTYNTPPTAMVPMADCTYAAQNQHDNRPHWDNPSAEYCYVSM